MESKVPPTDDDANVDNSTPSSDVAKKPCDSDIDTDEPAPSSKNAPREDDDSAPKTTTIKHTDRPTRVLNRKRSRRISFKSQPSTTSFSTEYSDSNRTEFRDEYSIRSGHLSRNLSSDHESGMDDYMAEVKIDASFRKSGIARTSRRASSVILHPNDPNPSSDSLRGSILSIRGSILSHRNSMLSRKSHQERFDPDMTVWQRFRALTGVIVKSGWFQVGIIVLIALNAIAMGLMTFDFVSENPQISRTFELADLIFLIIFTIELVLQMVYNGVVQFFCDGWLVFDFIVVVGSWALENFQIVRAFRIFRAFRLIARLELLKKLVQAIVQVMPRMYAISALLMLINYIYAVMCTELFSELHSQGATDEDYFSTLDKSLFTLFQMLTLDWSSISRQVQDVFPWAWAVFSSFVLISAFIVYNLIVAVVCEAVSEIEAASKKRQREEEAEMMGTAILTEKEFREEQLLKIRLMRSRLSHLIKAQNDILSSARFSLEGTDGVSREVSNNVLTLPEETQSSHHDDYSTSSHDSRVFRPRYGRRSSQHSNVPTFLGSIDDRTNDSISLSSSDSGSSRL